MRRVVAVAMVTVIGVLARPSGGQNDAHQARLADVLRAAAPTVAWDLSSTAAGDVTCDGRIDGVVVGYQPDAVWIGLVPDSRAPGSPRATVQRFAIARDDQDAFCAVPVRLELEALVCDSEDGSLPGCKPAAGCLGVVASDEACDAVRFYWDSERNVLAWWRR